MKLFIIFFFYCTPLLVVAQETMLPALPQKEAIALTHATIHIGDGSVLDNATLIFNNGKITEVGVSVVTTGMRIIDCTGKQVYPGLISCITDLGLNEISAVRSTRDDIEQGELNPNVRAVIAYNSDSKIINTVRSNGILLANVVPGGGLISGSSSVMMLDGWNWEDAVYKTDGGIVFHMPAIIRFSEKDEDPLKKAVDKLEEVRVFFNEAKMYLAAGKHDHTNLKFEAVKGLFNRSQTFFVYADFAKEVMMACEMAKEFDFKTVIVGGIDAWRIADYLKENNVSVILDRPLTLPLIQDDAVDMYAKAAFQLQQAGVLFAISDADVQSRYRNLPFNAGVAVGYGLTREQGLTSITLNAAKILGIADLAGSLEKGKDANIVVSDGDILNITTNNIIYAFLQGRQLDLNNKQKQLYERYKHKYNIR